MTRESVGTIVKEIRKMRGMRQIPFAEELGITQGCLSKIEKGLLYPNFQSIVRLRKSCTVRELRVFDRIWGAA